jgi:hypothetical protein
MSLTIIRVARLITLALVQKLLHLVEPVLNCFSRFPEVSSTAIVCFDAFALEEPRI